MRAPQPPGDQHERPDGNDGEIEDGAAHRAVLQVVSQYAGSRICSRQDTESGVATSRTVKGSEGVDEHSARCVARSHADPQHAYPYDRLRLAAGGAQNLPFSWRRAWPT